MKQKWKIVIVSIIAVLLMCPFITIQGLAAKENAEKDVVTELEMTYINPVYQDIVTEQDLKSDEDVGWHRSNSDGRVYETVESAGEYIRSCMKERIQNIEISFRTKNSDIKGQLREIAEYAIIHTGVPTEGDYIKWQYAGWKSSLSYYYDGTAYCVNASYVVTYYTTAAQEAQMNTAIETVLQNLRLSGKSNYEKVYAIYGYICSTVSYDYANLHDDSYKLKYTAYAALINKTAVCQGYAVLLYRLLLENKIDCRFISGIGAGGNHGWNIVKLGSRYYNLDSTWDAGLSSYQYFLKCNTNFEDHQRDAEYTTSAFNTSYPMSEKDYDGSSGDDPDLLGSGKCGDNLTWTFDRNGVLEIKGTGDMYDYQWPTLTGDWWGEGTKAPWLELSDYDRMLDRIIVGEGVTSIGHGAFGRVPSNAKVLSEIKLPDTLKRIGNCAFMGMGCNDFVVPKNLSEGILVFNDTHFKNVTINCPIILKNMFMGCASIEKVILSDNVTEIMGSAFRNCTGLKTLKLSKNLKIIEESAFYGCESLPNVSFPDSLTKLGMGAFSRCTGLVNVVIPKGVKIVSSRAFWQCTSLQSVKIENGVNILQGEVFVGCAALKNVELPSTLEGIGFGTFADCTRLEQIKLPEGLKGIYTGAFQNCKSLTEITIPASVTEITAGVMGKTGTYNVFCGNPQLTNIKVAAGNTVYTSYDGCLYSRDMTELIYCPEGKKDVKVSDKTKVIKNYAFYSIGQDYVAPEEERFYKIEDIYFNGDAPEIADLAFKHLIANAHYPSNNSTWTSDKLKEYGGKIKWIQENDLNHTANPFTDISKNEYFYNPVLWAYKNGVTGGTSATTFGPNDTCTRAQVVTFLWKAYGSPEPVSKSCSFADVSKDAYYYKPVLWAVEKGITSGINSTTFGSNDPCTRAQVVCFLWSAAGKPASSLTTHNFKDVSNGAYYYRPVLWALEHKITSGVSSTAFGSDAVCTRGQVVTFLYTAVGQ